YFIRAMASRQLGQSIRDDGPQSHQKKSGTPTMGGLLILGSVFVSTLLWADLSNGYIWVVLFVMAAFGFIGWLDDYRKIQEKNSKGLSEREKMFWQSSVAAVAIAWLFWGMTMETTLQIPVLRHLSFNLGYFYLPFAWLVIVGASNAVNLTDGLDGLAIGPIISTALTFGILVYLCGNVKLADYLLIPY